MKNDAANSSRWTEEQAWTWYNTRPWLCGFNYLPSSAVNSTEMWQEETFDLPTIEREMGWAGEIGLNTCRVFLQYLVWEQDRDGFLQRLDRFLAVAHENGIVTLPILFDDCAFAGREPYLGPQDEPVPGIHNSGWTPSPGKGRVLDKAAWPSLREYVHSIIERFSNDVRILAWDLYNEPGNSEMQEASLPLLQTAFSWARQAQPSQPLTAGIWTESLPGLNAVMVNESDIVSFHDYNTLAETTAQVARLQATGRPLLCTEWMRRGFDNHFETHLPLLAGENIGCFFWGLVNGRTQTHFPWGSPKNASTPTLWFHDLLDASGLPHRSDEVALIRHYLAKTKTGPPPCALHQGCISLCL